MKKILCSMFALFMCLGLTGCDLFKPSDEDPKEISFEEYLNTRKTLSASDLDESVPTINVEDLNVDLNDVEITNARITGQVSNETQYGYMWKETSGTNDYLHFSIDGMEGNIKINVDDLNDAIQTKREQILDADAVSGLDVSAPNYDGEGELSSSSSSAFERVENMIEFVYFDSNNSGKVELSECIDNFIVGMGLDAETVNVNNILHNFKFDIDDFEDKGKGVYQLTNAAISEKLSDMLGVEVPAPEGVTIEVTYADNNIQKIELDSRTVSRYESGDGSYWSQDVLTEKVTLQFTHKNSDLVKTAVKVSTGLVSTEIGYSRESMYFEAELVVGDNEFGVSYAMGETATAIDSASQYSVKEENGKIIVVSKLIDESVEIIDFSMELIGNWISSLQLNINYPESEETFVFSILSNVNVSIPSAVKNSPSTDYTQPLIDLLRIEEQVA